MVYGAHLARAAAAKSDSVIVCEGYTDVLALHQAGVENVVASMGTALTEDQLAELRRLGRTVQLALDADDAGQDAMLRASKVAAGKDLELRVVPLPEGRDPADVALEEGADAVRELVAQSVPFVEFQVERALAQADVSSAEGKDVAIGVLRPVFAAMPASVLKQELLARSAQRLGIGEDLARELLVGRAPAAARPASAPPEPAHRAGDRRAQMERGFLVLCIALPEAGRKHLDEVTEEHFTDPLNARAAVWLRNHLDAPTQGLPESDAELDQLVRRLADHAAKSQSKMPTLEVDRLQLELALLDRQMAQAPAGHRSELAHRRIELRSRLDDWIDRSLG